MTDFSKIPEYGLDVATDEYRSGLHYPAVIRELGELRGKRILDIGTGNSTSRISWSRKALSLWVLTNLQSK
jgi:hypothetical protein